MTRLIRLTPLEWPDVADAPELATLSGMDALLQIAVTALLAAHPELQLSSPVDVERAPPSLWLAEVIVDAAATLRVYLDRYGAAVRKERRLADGRDDDIPS